MTAILGISGGLWAQDLPLKKVSLYSSGVGFFEHEGKISGSKTLRFPFTMNAINDALKSLVVSDSAGDQGAQGVQINYPSESAFWRPLQGLKIDISGNRSLTEILRSLQGAEVSINTGAKVVLPVPITGRIVTVDGGEAASPMGGQREITLTLNTSNGLRIVSIKDIHNITFKDKAIAADLARALDLINSRDTSVTRSLSVDLPGKTNRAVNVSYVIPTPIWKVSYRLDIDAEKPFLQGWAIIDNDGDIDWKDITLSLVTGRQVSFSQNLYDPYYQARPSVPLSIAGVAEARTYEDTLNMRAMDMNAAADRGSFEPAASSMMMKSAAPAAMPQRFESASGGRAVMADSVMADDRREKLTSVQGQAITSSSGEQFEFTFTRPVSLPRQRSTMLPLVEAPVEVKKTLIYTAGRGGSQISHPQISAELTNTTGMKLPAGAITVFSGGAYAGDALLNFFPEGEKRYISFGDDLTVQGQNSMALSRFVSAVKISKGMLTFQRTQSIVTTYTFRNAEPVKKEMVVEHPKQTDAKLKEPAAESETAAHYRFNVSLPAAAGNAGIVYLAVTEERPVQETAALARLTMDALLAYSTNAELPENVRNSFAVAHDLRRKAEDARRIYTEFEDLYSRLSAEQERIRKNLEAAGRETEAGKGYLTRLSAMDKEIDACLQNTETARQNQRDTQKAYEDYIQALEL